MSFVAINGYNFILLKCCKQKGGFKLIELQMKENHAAKTILFFEMRMMSIKSIDPERNPHSVAHTEHEMLTIISLFH